MNWIARALVALTGVLGTALMAVSAYAASSATPGEDPAASLAEPVIVVDDGERVPFVVERDEEGVPLELPAALSPRSSLSPPGALSPPGEGDLGDDGTTPEPTATPAEIRYAPPEQALSLTGARRGRNDLTHRPRAWDVLSLGPPLLPRIDRVTLITDIPPDQLAVMQQASLVTGIPWQVLAAIAKVESDFGRNMATSSAGAIGYGQFLPVMWSIFGEGGDPYDFQDAIPAMARYLLEAGAPADLHGAIYSYNHSWEYVEQVLAYAAAYGYPAPAGGVERGLIWPLVGPITSQYGPGHPLGIDIGLGDRAGAVAVAATEGTVLFAGGERCCSYGLYVIVSGPLGVTTLYGHFDQLLVTQGQHVARGQKLGIVGCTGYCSGPHLHFEVIDNGARANPLDYLP
jgi:murein DD-endopeptidase MepM/ murein hydrolase activator NlpD